MGSSVALARATQLVSKPPSRLLTAPRQLDLVLDDIVLQGMTAAQRQAALESLAQLVLEASGAVTREVGDDSA